MRQGYLARADARNGDHPWASSPKVDQPSMQSDGAPLAGPAPRVFRPHPQHPAPARNFLIARPRGCTRTMARKRVRFCERAPLHTIRQVPPDTMTPEQRRHKIAALLLMRAADARDLPCCATHCWQ